MKRLSQTPGPDPVGSMDHCHERGGADSCPDCSALKGLYSSLESGPPPASLRQGLRLVLEGEPVPAAPSRGWSWAGLAAAAVLAGTFLAPLATERAGGPSGGAATAGNEADVAVQIHKGPHGVVLEWRDGHGAYVVEKSSRADAWDGADRVAVHGAAWADRDGFSGSRITFYRVRPAGDGIR